MLIVAKWVQEFIGSRQEFAGGLRRWTLWSSRKLSSRLLDGDRGEFKFGMLVLAGAMIGYEEKARGFRERVLSVEGDDFGAVDETNQDLSFSSMLNAKYTWLGQNVRVFPISELTELDVW